MTRRRDTSGWYMRKAKKNRRNDQRSVDGCGVRADDQAIVVERWLAVMVMVVRVKGSLLLGLLGVGDSNEDRIGSVAMSKEGKAAPSADFQFEMWNEEGRKEGRRRSVRRRNGGGGKEEEEEGGWVGGWV